MGREGEESHGTSLGARVDTFATKFDRMFRFPTHIYAKKSHFFAAQGIMRSKRKATMNLMATR